MFVMTGMGHRLADAAGQVANLLSLTWRSGALLGHPAGQPKPRRQAWLASRKRRQELWEGIGGGPPQPVQAIDLPRYLEVPPLE